MSLAAAVEAAPGTSRPPSPYVGLVPYDVGDAAFFFGRSTEVGIVVANLRSAPLTILYGPSGVGKSSLLMAGAVHDLCEGARAAAAENPFAVCVFKSWREDPVGGVREAARAVLQELAGDGQLPAPAATLAETLRAWTGSSGMLLVILDQFEEYFQYHPDEGNEERLVGFAAELARIVNDPSLAVHILLSIREDAWAQLDFFEGHIPSLFANYVRVDHLDLTSAREAIEGPIEAWNRPLPEGEPPFEIEPALVEAVLDATVGEGLSLTGGRESAAIQAPGDRVQAPYLQLVLERLWRDTVADGTHTLTVARLEALGGAKKIVENHLRDALGRLTPSEQDVAADCFRFLVSPSKTKIAYPVSDLAQRIPRSRSVLEVAAVLDALCSAESGRILRAIPPAQDDGSTSYELYHDILAEPIIAWRKEYELRRKQEAEAQRLRAVRRRSFRIGSVLVLLVVVFAVLSFWAFYQTRQHTAAKEKATSLALATVAGKELARNLDDSLLLSLAAYRERDTVEARSSVISALEEAGRSGVKEILHGVPGAVSGVAFSPDGNTFAVAGNDGPDGLAQLWDVRTRRMVGQLDTPLLLVQSVVFSSDGSKIAVTGSDGKVWLWDVDTQTRLGPLDGTKDIPVSNVAFSSDGRTLAIVSDGKVRLWNLGTHRMLGPLDDTKGIVVSSVAFSSDGRTLAAVSNDGKVRLWDVGTHRMLGPLDDTKGIVVSSVAFSSDGRTLAAVSNDGKVRLWDVGTHRMLGQLDGPKGIFVTGVAFRPDGRTLAAVSNDGKVRLWDVSTRPHHQFGQLDGPKGIFVTGLAFRPDGRTLAVTGSDGKVRLWDVSTHRMLGQLDDTKGIVVSSVAFSSDGDTVAVASDDGKVRLWDVRTHRMLGQLDGPKGIFVTGVAFSPDERTLAVTGIDGNARLWDVGTHRMLGQLDDTEDIFVTGVAFRPDGDTLAVASDDGNVRLWDVRTHRMLDGQLDGPSTVGSGGLRRSDHAVAVAFSSDGRTLAVTGSDGKVRLWDVETRDQLATPLPGATGVAVSSDGTVASGSGSTVMLWEGVLWKDVDALKERVCSFVWGNLSPEEWDDLTHDVDYRASCD